MSHHAPGSASEIGSLPTQHDTQHPPSFTGMIGQLCAAHSAGVREEKVRLERPHQVQQAAAIRKERERLNKAHRVHVCHLKDRIATQAVRIHSLEEALDEAGRFPDEDVDMADIISGHAVLRDLKGRYNQVRDDESVNDTVDLTAGGDNNTQLVNGHCGAIDGERLSSGGIGAGKDLEMCESSDEEGVIGNDGASDGHENHPSSQSGNQPTDQSNEQACNEATNTNEADPPSDSSSISNDSQTLRWAATFGPDDNVWRCPRCSWEVVDEEDRLGDDCPEYAPGYCEQCRLQDGDEYEMR